VDENEQSAMDRIFSETPFPKAYQPAGTAKSWATVDAGLPLTTH